MWNEIGKVITDFNSRVKLRIILKPGEMDAKVVPVKFYGSDYSMKIEEVRREIGKKKTENMTGVNDIKKGKEFRNAATNKCICMSVTARSVDCGMVEHSK